MLPRRMTTVIVRKIGLRLLTVAADAEPMDVRSSSVCNHVSRGRDQILEEFIRVASSMSCGEVL
jgi:hypothetical protein